MLKDHPLLIRGEQITEKVARWTVAEHPHRVTGYRRGFEVRVYHYPAWPEPYLVAVTSRTGTVMDAECLPTAAAADAAALELLASLDGAAAPIGIV